MRLLIVTNDFPPTMGGIENYTYSLARRWAADEVVVLARWVPGCKEFDAQLEFPVVREPVGTMLPSPGLIRKARQIIHSHQIDAIHFPSALPLGLLGKRLNRPYAVSVHGGEFVLASRLPASRQALKSVCRAAAVALPESSFAGGLINTLVGDSTPARTVTAGVDPQRYGREAAPPADIPAAHGPIILSVSRLIGRKGPRTLIQALPSVLRNHPSAHLLIVGGGPDLSRLKKMTHSIGVTHAVTFAGPQTWDHIPAYYSAARIFALPTRARFRGTETEGLPLVFLEAAAAALPLVGGDVGGIADAVRPAKTGVLVDGANPGETADALVGLLSDSNGATRMGAAARKMVLEEFTWDLVAARYREALLEFCS